MTGIQGPQTERPLVTPPGLPVTKLPPPRQARPTAGAPGRPGPEGLARRAVLHASKGDHEEAGRLLNELLACRDHEPLPAAARKMLAPLSSEQRLPADLRAQATAILAVLTEDADGPEAAAQLLDDGLARWPESPVLLAVAAAAAYRADDPKRAGDLVTRALATDPDCADALSVRGRLELDDEHPDMAIETARQLAATRPRLGRALLAVAMQRAGRIDEDPGLVAAVLADLPSDAGALEWLADALADAGRLGDARDVLDHLLRIAPRDARGHWSRGDVRYQLEDYEGAAADLDFAAARISDPALTALRGLVAYAARDYPTAVQLLASLDAADEPSWVPTVLGWGQLTLGQADAARSAFGQALRNDPDDLEAISGLVRLALDSAGADLSAAEAQLRHALEIDATDETVHELLGEVLYRADRKPEALESFGEALRLDPANATALANMGVTEIELGNAPAGMELLTKAARQAPASEQILGELTSQLASRDPDRGDCVLQDVQRAAADADASILVVVSCRAGLAARQHRLEDAVLLYQQALEMAPGDEGLAYGIACALSELGRPHDGLAVLDKLPAPLGAQLTELRVGLLLDLHEVTAAREELARLGADERVKPWVRCATGEVYRQEGRRAAARKLLAEAYQDVRDDEYWAARTLSSLGTAEVSDGRFRAARKHLSQALAIRPGNQDTLNGLLWLYRIEGAVGDVTSLLDDLDARIHDDPQLAGDQGLALVRANALHTLGDYRGELNVLEEAVAQAGAGKSATYRAVLLQRGWAELALRQRDKAEASFLAAAEVPGLPETVVDMANALARVGNFRAALLAAARANDAHNPFASTAVAVIWLRLGAWQAAARYALPDGKLVPRTERTAYFAARALRMAGQPEKALEYAKLARSLEPQGVEDMAEVAECLLETGQTAKAMAVFTDVINRLSRRVRLDADDLALRGWCLLRGGNASQAGAAFLKALSATDKPAKILLDLVLVSAIAGDLGQVNVLIGRAREELSRLADPARRGTIAMLLRDLADIRPALGNDVLEAIDNFAAELSAEQATLAPVLDEVSQALAGTSVTNREAPAAAAGLALSQLAGTAPSLGRWRREPR